MLFGISVGHKFYEPESMLNVCSFTQLFRHCLIFHDEASHHVDITRRDQHTQRTHQPLEMGYENWRWEFRKSTDEFRAIETGSILTKGHSEFRKSDDISFGRTVECTGFPLAGGPAGPLLEMIWS